MNKRETNMKTIAGVRVTDKTFKRYWIGSVAVSLLVNAYVMNNGGWNFEAPAAPQAQVTVPVK